MYVCVLPQRTTSLAASFPCPYGVWLGGGQDFPIWGSPPVSYLSDSNLVDSARSHTLVSKIKPCMSKYKNFLHLKLRMAHYISFNLFDNPLLLGYL